MSRTLRSLVLELCNASYEGPLRVLIVEPRSSAREGMCHELRRLGCEPLEARTPLEAIHKLEWVRAVVHAVAIGPGLPRTRADELARFLEEAYPVLPVLIVDDGSPFSSRDIGDALREVARGMGGPYAAGALLGAAAG